MARKQLETLTPRRGRPPAAASQRNSAASKKRKTAALRDKIDGNVILGRILALDLELRSAGQTELDPETGAPRYLTAPMTKARFDQVKASLDVNFKLLNKVLPDMRTLDVNVDFPKAAQNLSNEAIRRMLDMDDAIEGEVVPQKDSGEEDDPLLR